MPVSVARCAYNLFQAHKSGVLVCFRVAVPLAASMDNADALGGLLQPCPQQLCGDTSSGSQLLFLSLDQEFFHALTPHKDIPANTAFQLCPVCEDRTMIYLTHFLQLPNILVERVFYSFPAPPGPKPDDCGVILCLLIFQQSHKIYLVPACLFQLPAEAGAALILVDGNPEHHL